ncbi:MAG: DUF1552 domain-containing protein [Myxococcaceae bacterium]|nr:DUF1552 domain-containing protein [Myxococcaceae bacterium]
MSGKHLSRRTFLRGGAVCIGLPLLDAMLPAVARAQASMPPSRFIATFMGTCTGSPALTNPAATGPFTAPLPMSFTSLQPVAQHVSILSGMAFPVYNTGSPTAPASALQQQHGGTISPLTSGCSAQDAVAPLVRGHTSDQHAADFLKPGSKFASLQMRVQAASYNGRTGSAAQGRGMSVRKVGSTLSELLPIESPARLFTMLFTGGSTMPPPTMPPPPGTPALPPLRKSVLDLVLADANRLTGSVGAEDRVRLDQHFTHIRDLERSLPGPVAADAGTTTGGGTMTSGCGALANPGVDPAISTYGFGGWANETQRGQWMADAIAYALACDLTRSVSWMLTHDQCWLNSVQTSGSTFVSPDGVTEIHSDSHNATADVRAKNANWGIGLWSRLISNLKARTEGSGTVLDRTFLSFVFAEGTNAHNKGSMTHLVAGYPSRVRNGVHIATGGLNPALVGLTGLKAIGMPVTQFGEISGAIPGLLI